MDIVVTVPKRELDNLKKEDEFIADNGADTCIQYWAIGRKPSNLKMKDRVYFVENGEIKYYHTFLGYAKDPICEVTGRTWNGLNLILKCPEVVLKTTIPMKGFQGFRYVQRFD
jgi:hypothetical protein